MQKRMILLIALLCLTQALKAQNKQQITLQEAVDIALKNNYQLKVAHNNVELAEAVVRGEKADFFPSLSANISGNKSTGRQFVPGTDNFVDRTVNYISGSLRANLTIFNGFKNINSLRSSEFNKKSEKQNLQWVKENIIFGTATKYLQVLLDKELLQIAKENLVASQKTLNQVKAQVDVGSRPMVDLYNQEATVAQNELLVTQRENQLSASKLQLIRQLQVDPLQEYNFVVPDVSIDQLNAADYQLEQLVSVALDNRSDLQSERLAIQAVKHQLKATKANLYPSLSLGASLSSSYSDQFFNPVTQQLISFNDQFFDANIQRSLGLTLQIPIFNNFDIRTSVQQQKINYKNARLSLEDTRLQVIQEVSQAYNDYQAVVKSLQSTRKALRAAKKAYEAEQVRYNVGAGTLIELSDANAQYVEAKSNRAQAVYNFIFQKKLLDYYVGKLNGNISFN